MGPDLDSSIRTRERGEPGEALADLRRIVAEAPSPRAWYELGRAFRELHLNAAADACFARALGDRGEEWDVEGMYDPAEPISVGIEDAEAWNALARLLLARGEDEAALAAAQRGIFLGDGDSHLLRALALAKSGRTREAVRAIGEARARGVERASLDAVEALLRRELGDREGARKAAKRALHWDPGRMSAKRVSH